MTVKNFQQFINEYELEGQHQTNSYHYYIINYYTDKDYNNFKWGEEIVSKLNEEKVYEIIKTLRPKEIYVETVEIDYDEALEDYQNYRWDYLDENSNFQEFDIKTNEILK